MRVSATIGRTTSGGPIHNLIAYRSAKSRPLYGTGIRLIAESACPMARCELERTDPRPSAPKIQARRRSSSGRRGLGRHAASSRAVRRLRAWDPVFRETRITSSSGELARLDACCVHCFTRSFANRLASGNEGRIRGKGITLWATKMSVVVCGLSDAADLRFRRKAQLLYGTLSP